VLRLFTEQKHFNYVAPDMSYDKETGDVTIIDHMHTKAKAKKIITNVDEVF